jgi:hypothetical protein
MTIVAASIILVPVIFSQNSKSFSFELSPGNLSGLDLVEPSNVTVTVTAAANQTGPSFLSIQSAQSGSVSQINNTTYELKLNNISDKTIMFSDRPDRIITSVDTADFVASWRTGVDNFAEDAPNAALVLDDIEERQEIAIVELYNPIYDMATNVLKYDIILENSTSTNTPIGKFGQSTLVIDVKHPTQY